ncbi:hypothetical protein E1X98_00200 [Listeria monocytogenes]|uniref:hypothetical protein n=1 Tax=Listeria monocytogenes TaxID=1639 RepID=UPI0010E501D8|nr:hypothetical protein [Listeria monocytogenes]EAE2793840.1 hypothetical protein [Listeria monocytogenes]EAE4464082.1 hypothetical protein [Listeria monocytogenes]HCO9085468.1 hypothetical protein [Listeria monocytogenes]
MKQSLLLTNPSPLFRYKILSTILDGDDSELEYLKVERINDPILTSLLELQNPNGSFRTDKLTATTSHIQATSVALVKLSFLGFDSSMPEISKAVKFLLNIQQTDGSWVYEDADLENGEAYDMVPLQTAFPLWGLSSVGYAKHPQLEKSYLWLLDKQLEDGAWPVGTASNNYGYIAGYRKLPNSKNGCRVNTTCALLALANHPTLAKDSRTKLGLDMLLSRRTFEKHNFGINIARYIGVEPSSGYFSYFAQHDLALVISLIAKIGGSLDDERIADILNKVISFQNSFGLWEYEESSLVTHWLTNDLMFSIKMIDHNESWVNMKPELPLSNYRKTKARY